MVWKIYSHNPIQKITENLWCVEGSLPTSIPLPRRMCVIKLADGRLVIHSAVCLTESAMKELETWGEPAFLVVPNAFHRIDAPRFAARYPNIKVLGPSASLSKIATVVRVDGPLEDLPEDSALAFEALDGLKLPEAAFIVSNQGRRSLILTDTLFNVPHRPGFQGRVLKWMRSTGGPRVTPLAQLVFVKNKSALAAHFRRLAELEGLDRLIPAHGEIIEENAPGVLRSVADRLAAPTAPAPSPR